MKIRLYTSREEWKMAYIDTDINRIRVTEYVPRIYRESKCGIKVALKWIQDTTGYLLHAYDITNNIELIKDMEEPESLIKRLKIGINIEDKLRSYIEESYDINTYIRNDKKEVIKITFKTKDEYIKCEFEGNGYRLEVSEYMTYLVKQIVRALVYGKLVDRYRDIDERRAAIYIWGDCKIVKAEHNAEKRELVYECIARCEFANKKEFDSIEDSKISNAEQLKYVALFWDNKNGKLIVYHKDTYNDEVAHRNKDDVIKNIGEYYGINRDLVIDTDRVLRYLSILCRREVTAEDIAKAMELHNEYGNGALKAIERQLRNGKITNRALDTCKYRASNESAQKEITDSTGGQIKFVEMAKIRKYGTLVDISCIYEVKGLGDTVAIVKKWKKEIVNHAKHELIRQAEEAKKIGASVEKLRVSRLRIVDNKIYVKFESQLVREIRNRTA